MAIQGLASCTPKIYVLSVKTFKARHESIDRQLSALHLNYEFVWDFDVVDLTNSDLSMFATEKLPLASISLVLKHFEAHRRLLNSPSTSALILEDDAILFDGFKSALFKYAQLSERIIEPHLIFFGGADNKVPKKFLGNENNTIAATDKLFEYPISTTEAYLTSKKAAQMRLEWLRNNRIELPTDHLFQQIDPLIGIKHFWPPSPLATQGSITGKFSSTLDSSRKSKSPLFLNAKYRYNRVRRNILPRLLNTIMTYLRK